MTIFVEVGEIGWMYHHMNRYKHAEIFSKEFAGTITVASLWYDTVQADWTKWLRLYGTNG